MTIRWYINRLRSMEPAELVHRVHEKALKLISRRRSHGWQDFSAPQLVTVFPGLSSRVAEASQAQRKAVADAAAAALAGEFSALGRVWPLRDPVRLFPEDMWRLDPVTGGNWPGAETYTFDVNYRHDGSQGDIKYAWEIGRLQTLPLLAMHFQLSGEEGACVAVEDAIRSWHRANPPFTGIGWASGIEVALRAISLILTRDILAHRLSVEASRQIGEILSASIYWLKRFPSKFSSANNHLIAELSGAYLTGLALGLPVERTQEELSCEILKQILPDGCGAEQTPTYAAFSVELVLFCLLAGRNLQPGVAERLKTFAQFAAWLPPAASFGDDDEGRVLKACDEQDYVVSVASAVAALLGGPALATSDDDIRAIVFGRPETATARPAGLRVFENGALSIWRGDMVGRNIEFLFDHGPLGYLSIAAHGHADALSVAMSVDGQPLLVDPGTWLYGSGGAWRDWFRSTPAHNTLNIGGESQSTISGAFNWSHKANARLTDQMPGGYWSLTAEQDGYERKFGVRHRRSVRRDGDKIVITDRLMGPAQRAEIVFQLASGLSAHLDDRTVSIGRGEEILLLMDLPAGEISITSGGAEPGEGGWVSPRFGVRTPAPRIAWRGVVTGGGVDTVLSPQSRVLHR